MLIYSNGQLIEASDFHISPKSPGFLFGYGLFETMKVLKGKVCFFDDHIKRMAQSCRYINLTFTLDAGVIKKGCQELIAANQIENGRLRLNYLKSEADYDVMIEARPQEYTQEQYEKGFALCKAKVRRNPMSPLSCVKSLNYMENMLAKDEAAQKGFDEAIFLNTQESLCEGTISNLFWVKKGDIYTPSLKCGILPGITRKQIIDICEKMGVTVYREEYSFGTLYDADEIFITNSLMGIMSVNRLEEDYFDMRQYKLTKLLSEKYIELLEGEVSHD